MLKLHTPAFLLLLVLNATTAFAQPYLKTEHITLREGLSQGYVSCLLQDQEGFLWFGTKNGLNRFDGYRFEVFVHDPFDKNSPSQDFILSLYEHGDFLLLGSDGLNIFHKKTRRFFRFPTAPGNSFSLSGSTVANVWTDAAGNIWLLANKAFGSWLLHKLTMPQGFWERLADWENLASDAWLEGVQVRKWDAPEMYGGVLSGDKKTLWIATADELLAVDTERETLKKMATFPALPNPSGTQRKLCIDSQGNIWISRRQDLVRFDHKNLHVFPGENYLLHADKAGRLWLTLPGKAAAFSIEKLKAPLRPEDALWLFDIPAGFASGMTDAAGVVWIGTNAQGILKFNPRQSRFRHLFPGKSIYSPPLQDADGNISFWDDYKARFIFHENSPLHRIPGLAEKLKDTYGRLLTDAAGNYWLLAVTGKGELQLIKTDPRSGNLHQFNHSPISDYRGTLTMDKTGNLWMGFSGLLLRFDPRTEQFTPFDWSHLVPEPVEVFALAQTPDRNWWAGTSRGLLLAKPKTAQLFEFQLFKNDPTNPASLRNNAVSCLLPDPADPSRLWLGTKGGGINRLNLRTLEFTHLTTKDGLPNDVIYGLLDDEQGNFWLSSNKGLTRYSPATGAIKNFTQEDGLQGDEFNTWAYAKSPTGELLFGGVNGLTVFHPDDLADELPPPPVFFTRLFVNNHLILPGDSTGLLQTDIAFAQSLTLPFSKNSITLEFASLDFSTPSKNHFRYYLEGAESPWAHEGAVQHATYLNLPPGNYAFKVKGSNGDGNWNETPITLKINILPPWYRSWWAWILYFAAGAGLIYGYIRFRFHRLRLQHELALEHRETERFKELDAFKNRFFTNITHEFRTPLTVILGMAERWTGDGGRTTGDGGRASVDGLKGGLGLIKRNGENLLRLINQILDLAKLESNSLKINYVQGDVLPYLRYVSESLHSLANAKNVMLRVNSTEAKIGMDYDPERLLQIVYNLLSNAIKFTPSGGRVTLFAGTWKEGHAQEEGESAAVSCLPTGAPCLYLTVSDTGAGIPQADLPKIFDRFFQAEQSAVSTQSANSTGGGTGIGLSLTKELVKAMGGDISVESQVGKGTTFTVRLPITKNAEDLRLGGFEDMSLTPLESSNPQLLKSSNPQLLLIEDNPDVVEYLAACLQENYQLDFAYNGRAGIERALETVPDLILSDVMMPEKDGFQVCEILKNDLRTSHVPIVLLTAKADVESRISGLRRGADAYLAKPFHQEELTVTLENLLELRRKLQAKYADLGYRPDGLELPTNGSFTHSPITNHQSLITDPEHEFLKKLRSILEKNLADADLGLQQIERKMGMSQAQFFRKMKALTGKTPALFIRSFRLQRGMELLRSTNKNVSEIAYDVGFGDPAYFSRTFSEEFGLTPTEVRRMEI